MKETFAKAGLAAKGVVYFILGSIATLAAIRLGGKTTAGADRTGVFDTIQDLPAGKLLLGIIGTGLLCYSLWRVIEAFSCAKSEDKKTWLKGARYFFSGITYLFMAYSAFRFLLEGRESNGNNNSYWTAELLSKPFGQWLVGIVAAIFAVAGFYQVWYGLSEKYKKHVDSRKLDREASSRLLLSGKVGFTARGLAWLIISYMFLRAAVNSKSSEAGGTGEAFQLIENISYGDALLAALGFGLMAYGVFNFIRARYEKL